jgi:hypothetical protein
MEDLIASAQAELNHTISRQSASLEEAVEEYKRRYKIHPPPNFDKWYSLAKANNIQFIDEYDTIHQLLLPFWSLTPAKIRGRAQEALGFNNFLMRISIRSGSIASVEGAEEWQQASTSKMIQPYLKYLPNMDLAFNVHDEPRVVLQHDDLTRLVEYALNKAHPAALAQKSPRNSFSPKPADLNDGKSAPESRITRFNVFAHQPTWTHSRQSCSPDSPARSLQENAADDIAAYATSEIEFVSNKTAFTDICNSPSLRSTYGFFDRPNAFNIVHDLFPIFSQSKVSSFQDLIYPSPWYWVDKVPYERYQDYAWNKKENKLYWRGSTTGGFSRNGGWRRQHRQNIVKTVNGLDEAIILDNVTFEGSSRWRTRSISKSELSPLMDVLFTHVGQCDDGDCAAQREAFEIAPNAMQQGAWRYKYLLDMDGNAFSGRFYAFLKSHSLIFKMAVFREWHDEWIKPWVHYIPLSLRGKEYFEAVRYFDQEERGRVQAIEVAEQGRDWAGKVLRNVDMELWLFRLLLEYGRVIDDDREKIGFAWPGSGNVGPAVDAAVPAGAGAGGAVAAGGGGAAGSGRAAPGGGAAGSVPLGSGT